MAGRYIAPGIIALVLFAGCKSEEKPKPVEPPKPAPLVIVKPKPRTMTPEERKELGFPKSIISDLEAAAGAEAEPFFETVVSSSENLRGENEIERKRLAGFSVRTANADEIIATFSRPLRAKGYLIFRSRQNYGNVPDVVTVIKGRSSYDILRVQKTEAPAYRLETGAIIAWLRERQKDGAFVVTGASQDRVEARFIRQPADMRAFARKVLAFAPDVRHEGPKTAEELAEWMKETKGFSLVWD
jgi:hypothetical protein